MKCQLCPNEFKDKPNAKYCIDCKVIVEYKRKKEQKKKELLRRSL